MGSSDDLIAVLVDKNINRIVKILKFPCDAFELEDKMNEINGILAYFTKDLTEQNAFNAMVALSKNPDIFTLQTSDIDTTKVLKFTIYKESIKFFESTENSGKYDVLYRIFKTLPDGYARKVAAYTLSRSLTEKKEAKELSNGEKLMKVAVEAYLELSVAMDKSEIDSHIGDIISIYKTVNNAKGGNKEYVESAKKTIHSFFTMLSKLEATDENGAVFDAVCDLSRDPQIISVPRDYDNRTSRVFIWIWEGILAVLTSTTNSGKIAALDNIYERCTSYSEGVKDAVAYALQDILSNKDQLDEGELKIKNKITTYLDKQKKAIRPEDTKKILNLTPKIIDKKFHVQKKFNPCRGKITHLVIIDKRYFKRSCIQRIR